MVIECQLSSERNKVICKFCNVLCVKKVKDGYIYWRINEQNLCVAVVNLYNEESSVAPHHPVLSVWQRIQLTGSKNMAYRIGTI